MDAVWQPRAEQWEAQGLRPATTRRRHEPEVPDPCAKVAEFLSLLHQEEAKQTDD